LSLGTSLETKPVGIVFSFLAGLLFGAGLTVSQMIDPAKILNFLDVAGMPQGNWDPSLALVMAGALIVTAVGYRRVLRRKAPLYAQSFNLPVRRDIDARLIAGSAVFGLGWGMVGLCPGPAIAGLATGNSKVLLFVFGMLAGMDLHRTLLEGATRPPAAAIGNP
jgi:uncharacterized membrane protein YedE/YeeE